MQVLGIPLGFEAIARALVGRGDEAPSGGEAALPPQRPASSAGETGSAASRAPSLVRQLLARHDVRQISPDELAELLPILRASGELGPDELEALSALAAELQRDGVAGDQRLDLLAYASERLTDELGSLEAAFGQETPESQARVGLRTRQLELLRKFAVLHREGRDGGIDAWA